MSKIVSITERRPVETTLPDGHYTGTWGGSIIEVKYQDKYYELRTDCGVRGMGYKVVVSIKDGVGTFQEIKN